MRERFRNPIYLCFVALLALGLGSTLAVAPAEAECWDCLQSNWYTPEGFLELMCCRSNSYSTICQDAVSQANQDPGDGFVPIFQNKSECSAGDAWSCGGWDSPACDPDEPSGGGGGQGYWEPDQGCVYDHTGFCSPECGSCIWSWGPDDL